MILHVTVDTDLAAVEDPANVVARITDALTASLRTVEGIEGFRVTRIAPEDEAPPLEAKPAPETEPPTEEETQEDV